MTLRWLLLAAIRACATHSDPASDAAPQQMLHDSITWVRAGQKLGLSPDSLGTRGAPAAYRQWAWPLVPESLWVSLVARTQ